MNTLGSWKAGKSKDLTLKIINPRREDIQGMMRASIKLLVVLIVQLGKK